MGSGPLCISRTPEQVPDKIPQSNGNISELVRIIGHRELSVKQMMDSKRLKNRNLTPAIKEGLVQMKYPDSPRYLSQKYLLTVKRLALYKILI